MNNVAYILMALQAFVLHKRYGVTAEYMEIVLRIEYHRRKDRWTRGRYLAELFALERKFPDQVQAHIFERSKIEESEEQKAIREADSLERY